MPADMAPATASAGKSHDSPESTNLAQAPANPSTTMRDSDHRRTEPGRKSAILSSYQESDPSFTSQPHFSLSRSGSPFQPSRRPLSRSSMVSHSARFHDFDGSSLADSSADSAEDRPHPRHRSQGGLPGYSFRSHKPPSTDGQRPLSMYAGEARSPIRRRPLPPVPPPHGQSFEPQISAVDNKRLDRSPTMSGSDYSDQIESRNPIAYIPRSTLPQRRSVFGDGTSTPDSALTPTPSLPHSRSRSVISDIVTAPEAVGSEIGLAAHAEGNCDQSDHSDHSTAPLNSSPSRNSSIRQEMTPSHRHSTIIPSSEAQRFLPSGGPGSSFSRLSSPVKSGVGAGFVQSARVRRNDSLNKRWSMQSRPGDVSLDRRSSVTSVSSNSDFGSIRRSNLPLQNSQSALEALSRGRDSNGAALYGHGHRVSASMSDLNLVRAPSASSSPSRAPLPPISDMPQLESTLSETPAPPSPGKRWSPAKSSWLESALSKRDIHTEPPPLKPKVEEHPQWMTDLAKARASKQTTPDPAKQISRQLKSNVSDSEPTALSHEAWGRDRLKSRKPDPSKIDDSFEETLLTSPGKPSEARSTAFRATLKRFDATRERALPNTDSHTPPIVINPELSLHTSGTSVLPKSAQDTGILHPNPSPPTTNSSPLLRANSFSSMSSKVDPTPTLHKDGISASDATKSPTENVKNLRAQLHHKPPPTRPEVKPATETFDFRSALRSRGPGPGSNAASKGKQPTDQSGEPVSELQAIFSKFKKGDAGADSSDKPSTLKPSLAKGGRTNKAHDSVFQKSSEQDVKNENGSLRKDSASSPTTSSSLPSSSSIPPRPSNGSVSHELRSPASSASPEASALAKTAENFETDRAKESARKRHTNTTEGVPSEFPTFQRNIHHARNSSLSPSNAVSNPVPLPNSSSLETESDKSKLVDRANSTVGGTGNDSTASPSTGFSTRSSLPPPSEPNTAPKSSPPLSSVEKSINVNSQEANTSPNIKTSTEDVNDSDWHTQPSALGLRSSGGERLHKLNTDVKPRHNLAGTLSPSNAESSKLSTSEKDSALRGPGSASSTSRFQFDSPASETKFTNSPSHHTAFRDRGVKEPAPSNSLKERMAAFEKFDENTATVSPKKFSLGKSGAPKSNNHNEDPTASNSSFPGLGVTKSSSPLSPSPPSLQPPKTGQTEDIPKKETPNEKSPQISDDPYASWSKAERLQNSFGMKAMSAANSISSQSSKTGTHSTNRSVKALAASFTPSSNSSPTNPTGSALVLDSLPGFTAENSVPRHDLDAGRTGSPVADPGASLAEDPSGGSKDADVVASQVKAIEESLDGLSQAETDELLALMGIEPALGSAPAEAEQANSISYANPDFDRSTPTGEIERSFPSPTLPAVEPVFIVSGNHKDGSQRSSVASSSTTRDVSSSISDLEPHTDTDKNFSAATAEPWKQPAGMPPLESLIAVTFPDIVNTEPSEEPETTDTHAKSSISDPSHVTVILPGPSESESSESNKDDAVPTGAAPSSPNDIASSSPTSSSSHKSSSLLEQLSNRRKSLTIPKFAMFDSLASPTPDIPGVTLPETRRRSSVLSQTTTEPALPATEFVLDTLDLLSDLSDSETGLGLAAKILTPKSATFNNSEILPREESRSSLDENSSRPELDNDSVQKSDESTKAPDFPLTPFDGRSHPATALIPEELLEFHHSEDLETVYEEPEDNVLPRSTLPSEQDSGKKDTDPSSNQPVDPSPLSPSDQSAPAASDPLPGPAHRPVDLSSTITTSLHTQDDTGVEPLDEQLKAEIASMIPDFPDLSDISDLSVSIGVASPLSYLDNPSTLPLAAAPLSGLESSPSHSSSETETGPRSRSRSASGSRNQVISTKPDDKSNGLSSASEVQDSSVASLDGEIGNDNAADSPRSTEPESGSQVKSAAEMDPGLSEPVRRNDVVSFKFVPHPLMVSPILDGMDKKQAAQSPKTEAGLSVEKSDSVSGRKSTPSQHSLDILDERKPSKSPVDEQGNLSMTGERTEESSQKVDTTAKTEERIEDSSQKVEAAAKTALRPQSASDAANSTERTDRNSALSAFSSALRLHIDSDDENDALVPSKPSGRLSAKSPTFLPPTYTNNRRSNPNSPINQATSSRIVGQNTTPTRPRSSRSEHQLPSSPAGVSKKASGDKALSVVVPRDSMRQSDSQSIRTLSKSAQPDRASTFGSDAATLFSIFFGFVPKLPPRNADALDAMSVLETSPYETDKALAPPNPNRRTVKLDVFHLRSNGTRVKVPDNQKNLVFSTEMFIFVHVYTNQTSNPPQPSSGFLGAMTSWRSRKSSTTTEIWLWVGSKVRPDVASRGQSSAMLAGKGGSSASRDSIRVVHQARETPEFLSMINGPLITFLNTPREFGANIPFPVERFMLCVRRHMGQMVLDQTDSFSLKRLSSGFPFIVVTGAGTPASARVTLWKGRGSYDEEIACARDQAQVFARALALTGPVEISEVDEGCESEQFLKQFPESERKFLPRCSDGWKRRAKYQKYHPRFFRFLPDRKQGGGETGGGGGGGSGTGVTVTELAPFTVSDFQGEGVIMIDAWSEIYILPSPACRAHPKVFTASLSFTQDYAILAPSLDERPFVPVSNVIMEGFPRDVKAVVRGWMDGVAWREEKRAGDDVDYEGESRPIEAIAAAAAAAAVASVESPEIGILGTPGERRVSVVGKVVGLTEAISVIRPE